MVWGRKFGKGKEEVEVGRDGGMKVLKKERTILRDIIEQRTEVARRIPHLL